MFGWVQVITTLANIIGLKYSNNMIKYNNNTIYDWNFDTSNIIKVYRNNAIVFYKVSGDIPTPTGSTCYEIISTPITSYTSTTYDSVYSFADSRWYMLNNLNGYEEYGVYDIVEDIASATTYDGKLAVVGTTEYQYSGGSWSVVGTYEDESVTYEIDDTDPSPYVGQELATTFKVPYTDVEAIGDADFIIRDNNSNSLNISLTTDGWTSYGYEGSESYEGTVTNDSEYFYLSLPSEAPQNIIIENIDYWSSTPIHLIVGSKQVTVEYVGKDVPLADVYNTVAEMETVGCPTVGVKEYGVVGNDSYQFDGEDWNSVSTYKLIEKNTDDKANVLPCNSSTELVKAEVQPSYFKNITDVVIGDCVTSIGQNAFSECRSLTSITIPSGVTSIGDSAFNGCSSLTSVTITNSVTSISNWAFRDCSSLKRLNSDIDGVFNIPSSVTSISFACFWGCASLTSIDIPNSVTSFGQNAFYNCSSLSSVTIPSGVTSIPTSTFGSCSSLTSIDIPSGVTSIGNYAFNSCRSLTSITVRATTPPTLGNGVFTSTNNCPIYVPSASVNAYKSANNWSTYASRIQAIPT